MVIIITGNPVDGFTFIGPFNDSEEADAYAVEKLRGEEWWIADMSEPDKYWLEAFRS